jgi:hypothetical protein
MDTVALKRLSPTFPLLKHHDELLESVFFSLCDCDKTLNKNEREKEFNDLMDDFQRVKENPKAELNFLKLLHGRISLKLNTLNAAIVEKAKLISRVYS